jgi:hypothetical protein
MTLSDWLILGGYAMTILSGVIIAVQKLNTASITAKAAQETANKLTEGVNAVNMKVTENSIELSHLQYTVEKHDARLTRLENHSINH